MKTLAQQVVTFPAAPGVYLFKDGQRRVLYVGKATNLRARVRSYLSGRDERGERIINMVALAHTVDFMKTDSVLEALILEANLIKKYQPKYNVDLKDDKSFSYFVITRAPKQGLVRGAAKEKFPRVLIMRGSELEKNRDIIQRQFGPYTSKRHMEVALGLIRRIFPFHSLKQATEKGCLDFQLGRCPGPYAGVITRTDYLKNIRGIRMILEGKKRGLVKKLEQEMKALSKAHEFEKAAVVRNKVFALQHIRDIALISNDELRVLSFRLRDLRIEAYDMSNISGKNAVGGMVVFRGSEPDKAQYRKFKIKTVAGNDDVAMMREVLVRRFGNDWPRPDLIILDGGQGHLNMGAQVLREFGLEIPMVAVAKGPTRKISNAELLISKQIPITKFSDGLKNLLQDKNFLKHITDEAHRFAIQYHRKVRKQSFILRVKA
ncbi:hypothetical protein EPO05_00185 [Patescibacteria group bacterium]|nr:MAG: hypothetical protein EPO05_00185 [Patescibacteria group bacterium]